MQKELKAAGRAVTTEDFEILACSTPELRVARAKAFTLFEPGLKSGSKSFPVVNVVVVPYSNKPKPVPGKKFLSTVCRYLHRHRLITTELRVIPPEYVEASIAASVIFKPGFKPDQEKIIKRINQFISPFKGGLEGEGWPFGRTVYKSEIYELIEKIEGVDYVDQLTLAANGAAGRVDEKGNVILQPNGLVYSGEHRIEAGGPKPDCSSRKG
jgi:predicted phage baseplate assembly protein